MTGDQALILIVDDDYDFLEINRLILEGAGYRVVTATNPARGASSASPSETPDLVITDLMMTSVDSGFAFSAQLKDDPRTAGVPDHHLHVGEQPAGPRLPPARPTTTSPRCTSTPTSTSRSTPGRCSPRSRSSSGAAADAAGPPDDAAMHDDRVAHPQLVTTIREKCRMCYTCVRECPAKAIQIVDGQASVIQTRCIGCGNCVAVCSQNAKQVLERHRGHRALLAGPARRWPPSSRPSFPAEFTEMRHRRRWSAMLRALGFDVRPRGRASAPTWWPSAYAQAARGGPDGRYITTTCPAVVSYVRKYHPDLLADLAPIVSPMVAIARVLHAELRTPTSRSSSSGPCIAKKGEASVDAVDGEVDAVLTFAELRDMFAGARHRPGRARRPPTTTSTRRTAASAPLFPITRRPAADGRPRRGPARPARSSSPTGAADFVDAITEFEHGARRRAAARRALLRRAASRAPA